MAEQSDNVRLAMLLQKVQGYRNEEAISKTFCFLSASVASGFTVGMQTPSPPRSDDNGGLLWADWTAGGSCRLARSAGHKPAAAAYADDFDPRSSEVAPAPKAAPVLERRMSSASQVALDSLGKYSDRLGEIVWQVRPRCCRADLHHPHTCTRALKSR